MTLSTTYKRTGIIAVTFCTLLLASCYLYQESLPPTKRWAVPFGSDPLGPPPPHHDHADKDRCFDPYRAPGYLYIPDSHSNYNQTQWIPFTDQLLHVESLPVSSYPPIDGKDVFFTRGEVEEEFLTAPTTPKQWMQLVKSENEIRRSAIQSTKTSDFAPLKDHGVLSWLWDRRVVLVGDSVDRFMTQFFCEELGSSMTEPERHTTATCHIPSFNLTITHWHFPGTYTSRPDWWWMPNMKLIPFEERWEQLWSKTDVPSTDSTPGIRGPNGIPDLVMWQSGLWDQRMMWESGEAHAKSTGGKPSPLASRTRQMCWEELRFTTSRLRKLLQHLHLSFGPDLPLLYRTITTHRDSDAKDANLYEIDRVSRFVASKEGSEVFEWGRCLSALTMLYMDQTHPAKGAASWLWGNMLLEYLKRSSKGWGECHQEGLAWGGR
ncbi:hypothetical protein G7K_0913-t1 [Saitoella complicata NRRL Y-17804]|uniref:Uncharacterized protein n=2 Tax=Saitoella complicata (strain BCRC 22490 / CBS 7301 / JCM 7358 / NBRC 10748 / NRRL Y-17804) TaxID=698492 RepID=A0A0E9NA33_SAICN|nr:hypothetical protein G7K_0913-t1 [Saitoella complicata NRRL Y-17804]